MFAKRTIRRLENRYYHISVNLKNESAVGKFHAVPNDWMHVDYNYLRELNNKQIALVDYLNGLAVRAYHELMAVRKLPWWRKLAMA